MDKRFLLIIIAIIGVLIAIGLGIIISDESVSLNGVKFNAPEEYVISNKSNNSNLIMVKNHSSAGRDIEIKVSNMGSKDLKGDLIDINGTKIYINYIYTHTTFSSNPSGLYRNVMTITSQIKLANITHDGKRALFEKDGKYVTIDFYSYNVSTSEFKNLIEEIIT